MKRFPILFLVGLLVLAAGVTLAQRRRGGWFGESYVPPGARTAREVESHSTGTPVWTNTPGFERDGFTFTRMKREHNHRYGYGRGDWSTDCPDSDLNLSHRLQQMTSLVVDPDGRLLDITDPELFNYPWIYMVEVGSLIFREEELPVLRRYLLNGGFLMADDFWGENEWANFEEEMKRVFPEDRYQFAELKLTDPLYRMVFPITEKGQVPNVGLGRMSEFDPEHVTWEKPDAREVHHRVLSDDKGRMMVIATHNTDNGDGWEREGENHYFFKNFSEKYSFPLGINIIVYAMTH
ncbi:MAG: hypothetical protein QOF48_2775 [Verrucomicrobiota bacterium]|jgi:hypothetical protein